MSKPISNTELFEVMLQESSVEELRAFQQMAFEEIKHRGLRKIRQFRIGEEVKVSGNKSGHWVGRIVKINPKKLVIEDLTTHVKWTVPPTMVEKCSQVV